MRKKEILKRFLLCLLVFTIAVTCIGASRASRVYDEATDLMSSGEYGKAAEAFDSISSYEDAAKLGMYCKACQILLDGDYEEAYEAFDSFGDYKDCSYLKVYSRACQLEQDAFTNPLTYLDAASVFHSIRLFKDSTSREERCYQELYEAAEAFLEKKAFYQAARCFAALEDYKDSEARVEETYLEWEYYNADELYLAGDYESAIEAFDQLGDFKDSADRAEACRRELYEKGEQFLAEGSFDEAISCFTILGDYLDSPERIIEVNSERDYQKACAFFDSGDFESAIDAFEKLGDYKDSAAQVENVVTALGGVEGLTELGNRWRDEKNQEHDDARAMRWYLRAADRGSAEAMQYIGEMIYAGEGVDRDFSRAIEWEQKAAELGSRDAMMSAGYMYLYGRGSEQNTAKAIEWFQRAADAGSAFAYYMIGYVHENGIGIQASETEAVAWYLKADEQGDVLAWDDVLRILSQHEENEEDKDAVKDLLCQRAQELLTAGEYKASLRLYEAVGDYRDSPEKQSVISWLSELEVGAAVEIGRYAPTEDPDGGEVIEWLVSEIRDGSALLVTRNRIAVPEEINEEHLLHWLNGEFLNTFFSEEERDGILAGSAAQAVFIRNNEEDYDADVHTVNPAMRLRLEDLAETVLFAKKLQPPHTLSAGDIIAFGHYEQDNDLSNGTEEIEWLVLDVDEESALLLSMYGLDAKPYNKEKGAVTWESCTLRSWLNGEFLEAAFTEDERQAILTAAVDNSKEQGYSKWTTDGGNNTEDQVFLLSYAEAWNYFTEDISRTCKSTAYAIAQGAYVNSSNGNSWWWLRSPGNYQSVAAYVNSSGSWLSNRVNYGSSAVRPAFRMNLASAIFKSAIHKGNIIDWSVSKGEEILKEGDIISAKDAFNIAVAYGASEEQSERIREIWYSHGEALRSAGEWDAAVKAFTEAGEYRDAAEQIMQTRYMQGAALRESSDWAGAVKAFKSAGEFKDAAKQVMETRYLQAAALTEAGDYGAAAVIYSSIAGYKDAADLLQKLKELSASSWKTPGATVFFGSYEQDNDQTNGKEDIAWKVLDVQDDRVLLISQYALDVKSYNKNWGNVTWESSQLRQWLNGEFLNQAFTQKEQQAVLSAGNNNHTGEINPGWSTYGGNKTYDRVFLLSYGEAEKYFASDEDRICEASDYARAEGRIGSTTCNWWLRSPGERQSSAAYVNHIGEIYGTGGKSNFGVRPVIWVDLKTVIS